MTQVAQVPAHATILRAYWERNRSAELEIDIPLGGLKTAEVSPDNLSQSDNILRRIDNKHLLIA